jgi:uncharacterized protein (TIGR03086 family)
MTNEQLIQPMTDEQLMARAATALLDVVRGIGSDQLTAGTPCADRDVRALLNHLLFWAPSLAGAARKEQVAPPAADEPAVNLTAEDWAGSLEEHVGRVAAAWAEPGAWQGSTQLGGPPELPAPLIGGMAMGELVVHGWDLARATGQQLVVDDAVAERLLIEVGATAGQGRDIGVYGPEVAVPASAPAFDRGLGLTGRDPSWRPAGGGPSGRPARAPSPRRTRPAAG